MKLLPKYLFLSLLCFIGSGSESGEILDLSTTRNDYKTTERNMTGLQVPDSSLILLNRINIRRFFQKKLGRQESSTPCSCDLGICKCCTGPVLDYFNQKACMRITYHPGDFAFDVAMSMNDRVLYESSMSGKNPRPICVSPPRLSNMKVCAKFYNVFFPGRNFHFCLAMTGQWRSYELFSMAFDCLRMGANGIAMVSPEDSGGLPIANPYGGVDAVVDAGGNEDIEDYDENLVRSLLDLFDR